MNFGDDSLMILSDGQKEVSLARNTSVSYTDEILKKNCDAIYKEAPEIDVIRESCFRPFHNFAAIIFQIHHRYAVLRNPCSSSRLNNIKKEL